MTSSHVLHTHVDRQNERLVSTVDHNKGTERFESKVSATVKVPKKIVREDVIERIFAVPETLTIEVFEEDEIEVDELIVENKTKVIREKVIEVPEIEEVEVIIEEEIERL